jgi:hypothetical protein
VEDRRLRLGPLLAVGLAVLAAVMWGCLDEPECGESDCAGFVGPVWTRAVAAESTLSAVETVVDDLAEAVGWLWDGCCVPGTLTAAAPSATAQPQITYTPLPTYTAQPSATAEPPFCRRCIDEDPEYDCPGGYVCEQCSECYWQCVPEDSPRAGCNFCAGILIP